MLHLSNLSLLLRDLPFRQSTHVLLSEKYINLFPYDWYHIPIKSNQIKSTQFWESQFVLNLTVRQGHLILLLIKALAYKVMTSTCI